MNKRGFPDSSKTWSVDGKSDLEDGNDSIVRLVKCHDPDRYLQAEPTTPKQLPGVHYLRIGRHLQELFQFGNALTFHRPWPEYGQQVGGLIRIAEPAGIEPDQEIERALRRHIQTSLTEPLRLQTHRQGTLTVDETNAPDRPVGKSKRGPVWARIHVHNIGQGDTIVLELPNDKLWLIDARFWHDYRRTRFDEWMATKFPGRGFDRVIVSHMHYDHIRSIPWCIKKYTPREVVIPDSLNHPTTTAALVLRQATNSSNIKLLTAQESTVVGNLTVQVVRTADVPGIASEVGASKDPNDHEIAVILSTPRTTAFLAGDMQGAFCHQVLKNACSSLPCQKPRRYYKVSHHGSSTGYDNAFYNDYPATKATISCGYNNRYKHPHAKVESALLDKATTTWKTGQDVCQPFEVI